MIKNERGNNKANLTKKLNLPKKDIILMPASYWKRTFAFLIDFLIIDLIIISPFKKILNSLILPNINPSSINLIFESNPDLLSQISTLIIIVSILSIMYFSILQLKLRQTLGMMLFNLWIYSDNKEISIFKLILSNITFMPIFPFILLWIIDPIFLIFSASKQRLMQKLAGVYVVEEITSGFYQ